MYTVVPTRPIIFAFALALVFGAGLAHAKDQQTITVVNLNMLSGVACDPPVPDTGNQCRVRNRIALLMQHIAAAGCPDLVTLQENVTSEFVPQITDTGEIVVVGPLTDTVALIAARLPALAAVCGFPYQMIFDPEARRLFTLGRGLDEELILTRYPVVAWELLPLYSPLAPFFFRHVLYAQIDHPTGRVDVFTTHLASERDLASLPCGANAPLPLPLPFESPACPAACVAFRDTVRQCQAKQLAAFVEERHTVPEPAVISGDFNAGPGSPEYHEFTDKDKRGWLDSHRAVGNPVVSLNSRDEVLSAACHKIRAEQGTQVP